MSKVEREAALHAFVKGDPAPGELPAAPEAEAEAAHPGWDAPGGPPGAPPDPVLSIEEESLYVDGWYAAAVRLEGVFLVRTDMGAPDPDLAGDLAALLRAAGLEPLPGEWPLVEGVTLQRLGVAMAQWEVWGRDEASARDAVERAVMGEGAFRTASQEGQVDIRVSALQRGSSRMGRRSKLPGD